MGNFDRDRGGDRGRGGRDFNRGGFRDRGSRGSVEMHQATCDKCRKECEIPFRPTGDRPVYCSSCFEQNRNSDSRRPEGNNRSSSFEDRPTFTATCADCGNSCNVPFQPRGDKPVYCSSCFGEKKSAGDRGSRQSHSKSKDQLEALNAKLDKILNFLIPSSVVETIKEEVAINQEAVIADTETRAAPKRSSKKTE